MTSCGIVFWLGNNKGRQFGIVFRHEKMQLGDMPLFLVYVQ